ncbi:hypothetical protein O6H91_19G026600 [Diphasiastrum complanatum]|nr:hypothetical protein O6H91_19G026600 [Diphasiastrum complanatum]
MITRDDALQSPLEDLTIPSATSNPEAINTFPQYSRMEGDREILDIVMPNQLPKPVDSSMASSVTSLNRGDEKRIASATISSQMDIHSGEIDLTFGMRTNCCIRNIDEGTLAETGIESSGEVDSGRSLIHRSHGSTTQEKQISKSISSSLRNSSRTCSHCGTSKTPLWRSGPLGPKSLCNACGIRLKKASRRIAKIELQGTPLLHAPSLRNSSKAFNHSVADKYDRHTSKRSKLSITRKEADETNSHRDAGHEFSHIKSSLAGFSERKKLTRELRMVHVAPRDEEEGAALLMALSCGYCLNAES